jgi:hypothetical protein
MTPGDPEFTWTTTCPAGFPAIPPVKGARWASLYGSNHRDEFIAEHTIVAKDWSLLGGSVYARKTYQRSSDFPETTTMDLKHIPQ